MNIATFLITNRVLISLEKIDTSPNPTSPPTAWEKWILGSFDNQASLPISYTLKGYLMAQIDVGNPIRLLRIERNGIKALGLFESTPIVEIREEGLIETYNSIYRLSLEESVAKEVQ